MKVTFNNIVVGGTKLQTDIIVSDFIVGKLTDDMETTQWSIASFKITVDSLIHEPALKDDIKAYLRGYDAMLRVIQNSASMQKAEACDSFINVGILNTVDDSEFFNALVAEFSFKFNLNIISLEY